MEKATYIWMDGELTPWDEAKVHVLTHTLHYAFVPNSILYIMEMVLLKVQKHIKLKMEDVLYLS